jgi:peroxiredoxin
MVAAAVIVTLGVTWVAIACVSWFAYQLIRQNGRILARLDALEQAASPGAHDASHGRRFGTGSLASSRINRNGLTPGTAAPDFDLPRVDGGTLALREYLGRRVLLVFSSPDCEPCQQLGPKLATASRRARHIAVVMVSRGGVDVNRHKIAEHRVTFPVVLQRQWEISRLYAKFVTPMAYLIDERGVIASTVTVGVGPILGLLARCDSASPLVSAS